MGLTLAGLAKDLRHLKERLSSPVQLVKIKHAPDVPVAPPTNEIVLYAKVSGGVDRLYYKDSGGTERGPL